MNPIRHSKILRQRLTLKMLSIFRAPLMVRTSLLAAFVAILLTASSTCSLAAQPRVRHKAAVAPTSRRAPHAAPARATTSRATSRASHLSVSRTRSVSRANSRIAARARVPVVSRTARLRATRRGLRREVSVERIRPSHSRYASVAAAGFTPPARHLPASGTEIAEPSVGETPTAQAAATRIAATKIAAAEIPVPRYSFSAVSSPLRDSPIRDTKIVAMAPLRGSLESLVRQNQKTDADALERIENDTDLHARIASGVLVPVPASAALTVNPDLPPDRRYCRPWTATFLADLARAHQAQFHHAFIVSSAVRTVEYQKRLMMTNGNAASAEGDVVSPHLTGATIDIAKQGFNKRELYWMRNRLNSLQAEGKIDVEEEFRQSCFHITVYRSYVGAGPVHIPAKLPPSDTTATPVAPPTHG